MRQAHLILITGLPGTGKSTLARALARHCAIPLICKDAVKEPLFDVIGAPDRGASRQLSNASFAVMFSLLRDCLNAGTDLILEGNFRPGDHEGAILDCCSRASPTARIAQVLCQAPEDVRIARLKARAFDASRHPGHHDLEFVLPFTTGANPTLPAHGFLELPGERLTLDTHVTPARQQSVVNALSTWRGE